MSHCLTCFGNPHKNGEPLPRHVQWKDGKAYSGHGHRVFRCVDCQDTGQELPPEDDGEPVAAHPTIHAAVTSITQRGLFVESA